MLKTISTPGTLFLIHIFPAAWVALFSIVIIAMFLSDDSNGSEWFLLFGMICGSIFLYYFMRDMKKVQLTETGLLLSTWKSSCEVPFHEIESITESLLATEMIVIKFKHPTVFGSKITFFPRPSFYLFTRAHPLIKELEDLISKNVSE